jgi:hypothetical protein
MADTICLLLSVSYISSPPVCCYPFMSCRPSLPSGSTFAPISSGISSIVLTIMPGVTGALTPTSDSAKKQILSHQPDLLLHQIARRLIWKMTVSYDEKTI